MDGKLAELDEEQIRRLFEHTFAFLAQADVRPIGQKAKEAAFRQVMNYFSTEPGRDEPAWSRLRLTSQSRRTATSLLGRSIS